MYEIVKVKMLANQLVQMDIVAPRVSNYCEPGQFLILRIGELGERIPLTICDYDRAKQTVTVIFAAVGASTKKMLKLRVGDCFTDVAGPLGCASTFINEDISALKKKKFLFVAGGVGAAPVYPQVKWLHEHGVNVDVIVGARNKEMLILEDELEKVSGNLYITTDDGSKGMSGLVTDVINKLVKEDLNVYDECIAIGPMIMMKFVCKLTKELSIPTTVSMNPIMIDGTGMCGGCRLTVDNKIKFACVDGPEFDGHLVDFDEAMNRSKIYATTEGKKLMELEDHVGGCCEGSEKI